MQKILFVAGIIIALCFGYTANAQEAGKDSTAEATSSIEATIDYAGDSGFFGIYANTVKQPMLGSSFAYYGKKGLFLFTNGYLIGNSNPTLSKSTGELDLIGGWNFYFWDDAITLAPSYGHFFYSGGSTTAKSMFTDDIGLSANGNFNWFRPAIAFDYLFGTSKSPNLNLTTAFHLEVNDLLAKGNKFEFEPSVGTNYGDNSFYYRLINLDFSSLSSLRAQFSDKITIRELLALNVITNKNQISRQLNQLSSNATLGDVFSYTPTNQFNSIDFLFPVKYSIKKMTFNSALNISIPVNVPDFIANKTRIFFSAGISYSFDL
jgi:hypothetical protein